MLNLAMQPMLATSFWGLLRTAGIGILMVLVAGVLIYAVLNIRTLARTFIEMPISVKLCALWLLIIVVAAVYAKVDTELLDHALPLQNPDDQGFNPETGVFEVREGNLTSTSEYWLGTDTLKRDTFSRIIHGAWVSIIVSLVSAAFGIIVGGFLGSLVGYVRGRTEMVIMTGIDIILAFPALILLLAMVSIFEVRSLTMISLVIGFLSIPAYTRVARATSLAVSNREFVHAAQAIGTKPTRILLQEVIPNVMPVMIAYAMVAAAAVIVIEGTLSFLGLSVQPPAATWGNMINLARGNIKVNVWQVLWPSIALTLTVLSLNQVGDWFQKRGAHRASGL